MEEPNIRQMLKEMTGTDIQDAMDCTFRGRLLDNINRSLNHYLAENIREILLQTYLDVSKDYSDLQDLVDQSFLKTSRSSWIETEKDFLLSNRDDFEEFGV